MCLVFEVSVEAKPTDVRLKPRGLRRVLGGGRNTSRANLLDLHGCDLLSDEADWDAPTWNLTEPGRRKLADALIRVRDGQPGSWTFTALWHGDKVAHDVTLAADDLIELVRANRLGNFTRYVVSDGAHPEA